VGTYGTKLKRLIDFGYLAVVRNLRRLGDAIASFLLNAAIPRECISQEFTGIIGGRVRTFVNPKSTVP
jgi:hypothetical protein